MKRIGRITLSILLGRFDSQTNLLNQKFSVIADMCSSEKVRSYIAHVFCRRCCHSLKTFLPHLVLYCVPFGVASDTRLVSSSLRPIHTKGFAPGACSGGTLLEQSSFMCTNDFMGIIDPREQNFHPAKCSMILNWLNIREQDREAN